MCAVPLHVVVTDQVLFVLPVRCLSSVQIENVQEALKFGFCGPCPTDSPSRAPSSPPTNQPSVGPTVSPSSQPTVVPTTAAPTMVPTTGQPTMSPTGSLDACEAEPPSCTLDPDDGEDRVTFCLAVGEIQSEACVLVEEVRVLLQLGK